MHEPAVFIKSVTLLFSRELISVSLSNGRFLTPLIDTHV